MNLEQYQTLTGITVASGDQGRVTAQIARTRAMLETMLGYTLDPEKVTTNFYNELGKTQLECACPNVDTENLDAPDAVVGAYRLFNYDEYDKFFHVDPFSAVHKVKLVHIRPGTGDQGITLKTFDADEIRVHFGRDSWSKYIEHCSDCLCLCECSECVQLAVDATWLWTSDIPSDLLYVWADMVTHYADCKRNIKSESITTHSYTKFDKTAPESEPGNLAVIRRYAGPHGSVNGVHVA